MCQSQAHIPLKPPPLLSTPPPKQPAPDKERKQKSVKHRGPLTAPLCKCVFIDICIRLICQREAMVGRCIPPPPPVLWDATGIDRT